MIEIAQRAFARNHITVRYETMPWTDAIERARKGEFSGIVGAAQGDAPDFVFPSIAQGAVQNRFYVKAGRNWRYKGMRSLADVKLGIIEDYSYSDALDAYIKKYQSDPERILKATGDNALDDNIQKLMSGEIDILVEDKYVMDYYLSQHRGSVQVGVAGTLPFSANDDVFIAFSPAHPEAQRYAEMIAQETRDMKLSGELTDIMKEYGIVNW